MSKKTHYESMDIAKKYAESHPESADLINAFLKMEAHTKTEIKIAIGKVQSEACFASYLVSNLAFPNIKFSEENGNPLILIANHRENIAAIPITQCKVLSHQHIDFGKNLSAERDIFLIRLFNLDFEINLNYENRYIA